MRISKVKPDLNSILYYFDYQHHFFTKINVHFLHNKQKLRAILLFPFHKKGHFTLDKIEIYHHNQWSLKKGDTQLYGMALANHLMVVLLGNNISEMEQNAKTQLEGRFRRLVLTLAEKLEKELQQMYSFQCEVAQDSLSIITKFELNGETVAGKIETNHYFPHTVKDQVYLEEILQKSISETIKNIEKFKILHKEKAENQKIFVTTIPLLNPIVEDSYPFSSLEVSIQSEGYCQNCNKPIICSNHTNVKINLMELEQHRDDLLIMVVGDSFQCESCGTLIKKERIMIQDHQDHPVATMYVEDLFMLGYMNNQEYIQIVLNEAMQHHHYFYKHEEAFWQAFGYVAIAKWEDFIEELSRIELEHVLLDHCPEIPNNSSKETLLNCLKKLDLTVEEKLVFWKKANQLAITHYLFVTVFGWDMEREERILGQNRAEFIFQYLPYPKELKCYFERHTAYFSKSSSKEMIKLHQTVQRQQSMHRQLQLEIGRLTEKLGQAYRRKSELEQTSTSGTNQIRNQNDILKIQGLKGLIAELKAKISELTPSAEDKKIEEVILTEVIVNNEPEILSIEECLRGKNILILGGFRSKQISEETSFTIQTHDARQLDPNFYELLKGADIIIVLTRFISHRAMWEAKEYAILEEKWIHYTSFTNIPNILAEVVNSKWFEEIRMKEK